MRFGPITTDTVLTIQWAVKVEGFASLNDCLYSGLAYVLSIIRMTLYLPLIVDLCYQLEVNML
jgi:hypothetical protein